MAKSKHEKELARTRKKKEQRRRENDRLVERAKLYQSWDEPGLMPRPIDPTGFTAEEAVKTMLSFLRVPYVKEPSENWKTCMAMVTEKTKAAVQEITDLGFELWVCIDDQFSSPPLSLALLQTQANAEDEFMVEPVSYFMEALKDFSLEFLHENLDF